MSFAGPDERRSNGSGRNLQCRVCEASSCRVSHRIGHYRLIGCRGCGFVFLDPQPDAAPPDIYGEAYFRGLPGPEGTHDVGGWDYFAPDHMEQKRASCRTCMDWVEGHMAGGRLLDVGCGPGLLLAEARSRGWDVSGLDGSAFAVEYARRELGLDQVRLMDAGRLSEMGETVDAVTMMHMIEHVQDPLKLLVDVHGLLRRGGWLFIETPDIGSARARKAGADWRFVKIPEHLSYFSARSLREILARTGFKAVRAEYLGETTGLMSALPGGEEARQFFDRWARMPLFSGTLSMARQMKAIVSGRLLGDYDILRIAARKA